MPTVYFNLCRITHSAACGAFTSLTLLLTACGGGGSGGSGSSSSTPTTPTVPAVSVVSQFRSTTTTNGPQAVMTLDASVSTTSVGKIVSYAVAWGDGLTSTSAIPTITHTYAKDGAYPIVLTVTTDGGVSANTSVTVNVANPIYRQNDGSMVINIPTTNQIVSFTSEVIVPAKPDAVGVLAVWPGLQSQGVTTTNGSVGNGVLQPVLVWGGIGCSKTTTLEQVNYGTWWIEGYYFSNADGCHGGDVMSVAVGDKLKLTMALLNGVWTQTIVNATTGATVNFAMDMKGQPQNVAEFYVEEHGKSTGLKAPVTFSNITITLANPQTGNWCTPFELGKTDTMAVPVISADTKTCTIGSVTLMTGANTFNPAP